MYLSFCYTQVLFLILNHNSVLQNEVSITNENFYQTNIEYLQKYKMIKVMLKRTTKEKDKEGRKIFMKLLIKLRSLRNLKRLAI